jgi:hypothetical protein|uniref:hypothetical protein n=1 Tax=Cephaloticoccus sp. TaxID=1985742 RepID=UPI00404B0C99
MSIINNALKKAQRQRSTGAISSPSGEGGASSGRRGSAMTAQNLVLIIAGVAAVIVVSVVATVYLVKNSPEPLTSAQLANPLPPLTQNTSVDPVGSDPVVLMPEIKPAEREVENVATSPSTSPVMPAKVEKIEPIANPIPVALVPDTSHVTQDDRIYAYIETLQVVGIRSSGADSKVLMNNRVFRVNDMVDRELMLRLVKVSSDSLTFLDANGIIYTKYF